MNAVKVMKRLTAMQGSSGTDKSPLKYYRQHHVLALTQPPELIIVTHDKFYQIYFISEAFIDTTKYLQIHNYLCKIE